MSGSASTDRDAAVCERVMVTNEPRTSTFEDFFLDEYPRLVPMLMAWCGDQATAEDLAQDALVQAELHWAQVAGLERPGAWVRRVALNRSTNEGRRRRREAAAIRRLRATGVDRPPGPRALPDSALWDRVRALPSSQRDAVVLRYVDDLALADIARVLGCTEGTVKTHLQRARTALGAHLRDTDPPPNRESNR